MKERTVVMVCLTILLNLLVSMFTMSALNPMLAHVYELSADKSSMVYSVGTIGFFCGAPVAW